MDLNELFKPQKELDDHIITEHNLQNKDLLMMKTNALNCELWECVNESRIMKYWSKKKPVRERVLEEYVDGIHFLISIGNDLGYTSHEFEEMAPMDLNRLANAISNMITRIPYGQDLKVLFNYFIQFGCQLGFTEKEVIAAYYRKNRTNHQRQESGY